MTRVVSSTLQQHYSSIAVALGYLKTCSSRVLSVVVVAVAIAIKTVACHGLNSVPPYAGSGKHLTIFVIKFSK